MHGSINPSDLLWPLDSIMSMDSSYNGTEPDNGSETRSGVVFSSQVERDLAFVDPGGSDGPSHFERIVELIKTAQDGETVVLAAPFMQPRTLEALLAVVPEGARIEVFTSWEIDHLARGIGSTKMYDLVVRRGGGVVHRGGEEPCEGIHGRRSRCLSGFYQRDACRTAHEQ